MVLTCLWSTKQSHHAIARELLNHPTLSLHGRNHLREKLIQHPKQRRSIQLLTQRSEPTDVLEQNADLQPLAAEWHTTGKHRVGYVARHKASERILDVLAIAQSVDHL